jgi:uncharacterized protein YneF (UPF0154 family)
MSEILILIPEAIMFVTLALLIGAIIGFYIVED